MHTPPACCCPLTRAVSVAALGIGRPSLAAQSRHPATCPTPRCRQIDQAVQMHLSAVFLRAAIVCLPVNHNRCGSDTQGPLLHLHFHPTKTPLSSGNQPLHEEQTMKVDLYVGTVGMSVWFSKDLGETWKRRPARRVSTPSAACGRSQAIPALRVPSTQAATRAFTAGTRQSSVGRTCGRPMDGRPVWAIAQSPHDPRVCCWRVAGRLRSTARMMRARLATDRDTFRGVMRPGPDLSRPTQILFDPYDKDTIWVGVEVDALYRSTDGGRSWTRHDKGMAINRHPWRRCDRRTAWFQGANDLRDHR